MATVKAHEGQTLMDISIWQYGSLAALVAIAMINGLSVTATLSAGQVIILPEGIEKDPKVLKVFAEYATIPATGDIPPDLQAYAEEAEVEIDPEEGFFEWWEFTDEFTTDFN